jgi:hypothetical protein
MPCRLAALVALSAGLLLTGPSAWAAFERTTVPPARTAGAAGDTASCVEAPSVARAWNERLLLGIRNASARPSVHARNLYHVSAAMYDAWAAYAPEAQARFHAETATAGGSLAAARAEAISHAAYNVLHHRFENSVAAGVLLPAIEDCMLSLGYDPSNDDTGSDTPAALGNRVAATIIAQGFGDGSNESGSYVDYTGYFPANNPMIVELPGTGGMADVNAWQPLVTPGAFNVQVFLTPFWGQVTPFALERPSPGALYLDPGTPPQLGGARDDELKAAVTQLIRYSAQLDPDDGEIIDISPAIRGNNTLGTNDGDGHDINPVTGEPYPPNPVRRGDWTRVISEFWADGPASTTPPGHWNEIANAVTDHPALERRIGGAEPIVPRLEWDVKMYLALNGAMHDAAIFSWEVKHHYDSSRPISLIREMASRGQSSDVEQPSFDPLGLPLEPGLVEVITAASAAAGERHAHLADHVGEIAVLSWRGHPADPQTQHGGVDWIRGVEWLPYQQVGFVTPPFAGYTSGHSGFSRAAAEVLTVFTGSPWFPGGLGGYTVSADDQTFSLAFEYGPSEPVELQWATYYDASDEAGLSRIWGGIHPTFDDLPGRIMGAEAGLGAVQQALALFGNGSGGTAPVPVPFARPGTLVAMAMMMWLLAAGNRLRKRA